VSNLKSVVLTILEICAFNAKNLGGHVTMATPPFGEIFGFYIRTVPGNMCVKFEVCSSDGIGAIRI